VFAVENTGDCRALLCTLSNAADLLKWPGTIQDPSRSQSMEAFKIVKRKMNGGIDHGLPARTHSCVVNNCKLSCWANRERHRLRGSSCLEVPQCNLSPRTNAKILLGDGSCVDVSAQRAQKCPLTGTKKIEPVVLVP